MRFGRFGGGFQRDFEGVYFSVGGGEANFADFESGVVEDGVVEVAGVVVEIAGNRGVGSDGGGGEPEVGVVGEDLLVDSLVVDGDRGERHGQGDASSGGGFAREEAALELVVVGCLDNGAVRADELDAGVVERDGGVGIVRDDDADGHEAVVGVVETGVGLGFFGVAGLCADGDFVVCFVEGVLGCGEGRFGLAGLVGMGHCGGKQDRDGERKGKTAHRFDYALTVCR